MFISSFAVNKSLGRLPLVLLAAVPLLGAGCASRSEVEQIKASQREVRKLLASYTVSMDDIRRRLDQVQSQGGPAAKGGTDRELRARVDRMETRLLELESRVNSGAAAAPAAALPAGVIPPAGGVAPAAVPPPAAAMAPAVVGAAVPPAPAAEPTDSFQRTLAAEDAAASDPEYKAAVQMVRQGQCREAIPALRSFVRKSAKSPVADNAQYLIGSCYYQQKDYNRAIVELNEVLLKYPKGDKVPAALLMLADAFADSGDKIDAKLILQKLVNDHPQSEEAARGKQKLQALNE